MRSTRSTQHLKAPRSIVYAALVDASAIARWKLPDGMTLHVHEFEAREGGRFRVTLTYSTPDQHGKTTAHTDTYHGHVKELVPDKRVVEVIEFEATDPAMRGKMIITIELADVDGGTELQAVHEGLPPGLSLVDNETGWRMALAKLAGLLEKN